MVVANEPPQDLVGTQRALLISLPPFYPGTFASVLASWNSPSPQGEPALNVVAQDRVSYLHSMDIWGLATVVGLLCAL